MATLDAAIVSVYARFDIPADQIVTDPVIGGRFKNEVNKELPSDSQTDQATVNKRLLNLRRRGEDNGGLKRLRRGYNGRGPNGPR